MEDEARVGEAEHSFSVKHLAESLRIAQEVLQKYRTVPEEPRNVGTQAMIIIRASG